MRRKGLTPSSVDSGDSAETPSHGSRLHYLQTRSTRLKKRAIENVYDLFHDLESDQEDNEAADDGGEETGTGAGGKPSETTDDPTFELANVRRFIMGKEPVSKFVANSRNMFRLKVSLDPAASFSVFHGGNRWL